MPLENKGCADIKIKSKEAKGFVVTYRAKIIFTAFAVGLLSSAAFAQGGRRWGIGNNVRHTQPLRRSLLH
jgi:hypothetical protein